MNKLPPEIISHIVRYVPDEIPNNTSQIIPLTHVCRHWRKIIISTPEHWTSISTESGGDLAALSLERAKTAPLEIYLSAPHMREVGWLRLLRPNIRKTRSLCVVGLQSVREVTTAFQKFPLSTPNLQSLKLVKTETPDSSQSVDPFEWSAHSLRRLTLEQVPLYRSFLNLRALTMLSLTNLCFNLNLETLLDFLEENHSLESVTLWVRFKMPALRSSRRRSPIKINRLRHLSVPCFEATQTQALISNIALQRGAHLEIAYCSWDARLKEILTGISTAHLSNLPSPTFIEYQIHRREIQLSGPNGRFSFVGPPSLGNPFVELPVLPLANIRELRLRHRKPEWVVSLNLLALRLSFFPALETLAVECETSISYLLSALVSKPSSSPSLKTLAFLNCDLSDQFMEELTRFASNRKNTTSARLYHVVIVDSGGKFPSAASIDALEEHVPVVDARRGTKLPADLT